MAKKKHSDESRKPLAGEKKRGSGTKAGVESTQREAVFQPEFVEDLRWWVETDRKTALRILVLVQDVLRNPFSGKGKPEPLKYFLAGCWSRRISQEHRLVYSVTDERIDFLQARYHYS